MLSTSVNSFAQGEGTKRKEMFAIFTEEEIVTSTLKNTVPTDHPQAGRSFLVELRFQF